MFKEITNLGLSATGLDFSEIGKLRVENKAFIGIPAGQYEAACGQFIRGEL